ncbi:hypothetical protein MYX07_01135 [Patescibacteria group bacterium AH-259-L07]|nr:hypothetical protein [Patescibacteria group bacterium AH-259-L07]
MISQEWHKMEIGPITSLVILIISALIIFGIGALFIREYVKIWTEIEETRQGIEYFPEKPGTLEKLILP